MLGNIGLWLVCLMGKIVSFCNVSTYYNPTTEESTNVPFVQVDGVPTLGAPVNSIDRYIGNDNDESYVRLNTIASEPCMHKEEWEISFWTNSIAPGFAKLYAENGLPQLQYSIGTGSIDNKKLRVFIRPLTVTIVGVNSVLDVFDGVNRFVEVERTIGGDVTLHVDGVYELLASGLSGEYTVATDLVIGAMDNSGTGSTPISNFVGKLWDFTKCGQLIPLNEGTGTDIKDSTGASVGVLTDTLGEFWDYYLPRYMVPATGPLQCREDSVSNIALSDNDFSGDWTISGEMLPLDTGEFNVYFNYGRNNGVSSGIVVYSQVANQVSFEVRDNLGTFVYLYVNNNIMGTKITYEIKKVGTTVTTSINGILVNTDNTVDLTTNGLTINSVAFGGSNEVSSKGSVDHCSAKVVSDDFNEAWNFITRLPSLTDVNADKIIGTVNGTILNIIDSSPHGIYYPHIGLYSDVYLKSDKWKTPTGCITFEGGQIPMVDDLGIFLTDDDGVYCSAPQ